jgi:cell division protein FtsQ
MKFRINIKREIRIAAILLVVFALIAFTERMKGEISVNEIRIQIDNVHENHFLDEEDIIDLMQWNHEQIKGASIKKVNFKDIENRIKKDPFISTAEMYSDLKGNLMVNVSLRRPIARIVRNDGPDGYVAEDGTIMPVSEKFTSRVVLLGGEFVPRLLQVRNMNELEAGAQLMAMISMIKEDEFWNAQIAQLNIDSKGKVSLLAQVGDETIEFGRPDNMETKFKKLKIFYKEILPRVGWNRYSRVNLEYEGQVVAE